MKKFILLLAVIGMIFTACEPSSGLDDDNGTPTEKPDGDQNEQLNPLVNATCAHNEILYITKRGFPITPPKTNGFGAEFQSNTYENGIGRLVFNNDIKEIPSKSFSGLNTIEHIKISDSVTSIREDAFEDCTALTSVTIGKRVNKIENDAFWNCTSLTEIYCKPTAAPSVIYYEISYRYDNGPWIKQKHGSFPINSGMKIYIPRFSYSDYYRSDKPTVENRGSDWYYYNNYLEKYDFEE